MKYLSDKTLSSTLALLCGLASVVLCARGVYAASSTPTPPQASDVLGVGAMQDPLPGQASMTNRSPFDQQPQAGAQTAPYSGLNAPLPETTPDTTASSEGVGAMQEPLPGQASNTNQTPRERVGTQPMARGTSAAVQERDSEDETPGVGALQDPLPGQASKTNRSPYDRTDK